MAEPTDTNGRNGNGLGRVEVLMSEAVQLLEEAALVIEQARPVAAEGARYIAHYLSDMRWLEVAEPRGYAAARGLARLAGIADEIEATLARR